MSTKFKVGDKVKRSDGGTFSNGFLVGTVLSVGGEGRVWIEETRTWIEPVCISKIGFTKSDLKDGMCVVYRNGNSRVYFNYNFYGLLGGYFLDFKSKVEDFEDDLTFKCAKSVDIMKVIDRDGTVLFERVEAPAKSQQEIEMDKLQKQIAELSAQADKLKASMK